MRGKMKKNLLWLWITLATLIIIISGYLLIKLVFSPQKNQETLSSDASGTTKTTTAWQEKGVAISGKFADAEVVEIKEGKFRLYYSVEPEVAGNKLELYSATSTYGINWTQEEGTRKTMATFADVVKLPDGSWRMYFQNSGVIKSATSTDGLTWNDEVGTRIDKTEKGYNLENVGAQTTMMLNDGSYLMVYRGTIDEPYKTTEKIPNNNTQLFFYATSSDGINFTKKGIALDSRNDTLYGMVDGAEWVKWENEFRLYFWGYYGVYYSTYSDGKFSTSPIFDFTNNPNSQAKFAANPPGDPTLIKIDDTWFMYYGQHTLGIYYAVFADQRD